MSNNDFSDELQDTDWVLQEVQLANQDLNCAFQKIKDETASANENLQTIDEAQQTILAELAALKTTIPEATFAKIAAAMAAMAVRHDTVQQTAEYGQQRIAELETKLTVDHLTKAQNRLSLDTRAAELEEKQIPYAVIQCDLDYFKSINDTFGHDAGDQVLQVFTSRVQACLKSTDTLYRAGGDEFIVILEGATDPEDVLKVIDRLKTAVTSEPIVLEGKSVPLRSSMGGALCDWKETNSADIAKQAADKALYQDKESPARAEFKTVMAKISMEHTGAKAKGFRDDLTIPAEPAPPKPPKSSLAR